MGTNCIKLGDTIHYKERGDQREATYTSQVREES
jgi:hypothetical protein